MQEIKKNMKVISIGDPGTGRSPWFNAAKGVPLSALGALKYFLYLFVRDTINLPLIIQ